MNSIRKLIFGTVIGLSLGCSILAGKTAVTTTQPLMETATFTNTLRPKSTNTATSSPTITKTVTRTKKPSRTASPTPAPGVPLGDTCRSAVDGFYNLKKNLVLPDHLTSGEPFRKARDFDPNRYFPILNHLKMKTGYTLDYVYYLDDLGSKPLLYTRKTGTPPFLSYEAFLKSVGAEMSGERSYMTLPNAFDFLNMIQVDGSEASFFQFAFLAELGDQFYLSWHANYNDFIILCDAQDLKNVTRALGDYNLTFPQDRWETAKAIEFQPTVSIQEDAVTVRMIIFSKWGGFWENIAVMDKNNPFTILDMKMNVLVAYDCGINF